MMKCSQDKTSLSAPGQSLLKFMDMASDAVKCALKKPTNFKRNVNHRRYLQRQVKTFVKSRRSKSNCSRKIPSSNLRDDVQDLVREAIKELKFSHCYADAGEVKSNRETRPLPVAYEGQLNFQCAKTLNTTYRLTHLPEKPATHTRHSFPAHQEKSRLYPCSSPCSHTEDDLFMSVEELTNNIDINDLYIPELHEPKSPTVNCADYFMENDLEIPSPLYDTPDYGNFQFYLDSRLPNQRITKFNEFF